MPISESGKRKWNHLKFQCEETLAHLEFVREEAKDIKNFWPLALVRPVGTALFTPALPC
jgi:hypothetical protein